MRNTKSSWLKKCLFLDDEEFNLVVKEIFGEKSFATLDDCVVVNDGIGYISAYNLNQKLANYFGVNAVTSTHVDDCSYCIWIVYEE